MGKDPNKCSLSKLYWTLYESPLLGSDVVQRRLQRERIEPMLKSNSIVHEKKGCRFPNLHHKKTMIKHYDMYPLDAFAMLHNYSSKSCKQKKPLKCDEKQRPRVYEREITNSLPSVKPQQHKPPYLLRRPAEKASSRMVNDKDITNMAKVYREFQIGLTGARTLKFYQDNFPLLANLSTLKQLKGPTYRDLIDELEKKYVHIKRRQMLYKMIRLNGALYHLEKDSSEEFFSMLRDEEYEPRRWSINEFKYP